MAPSLQLQLVADACTGAQAAAYVQKTVTETAINCMHKPWTQETLV